MLELAETVKEVSLYFALVFDAIELDMLCFKLNSLFNVMRLLRCFVEVVLWLYVKMGSGASAKFIIFIHH